MLAKFFAPLTTKIILGLVIALGLMAWRADAISGQKDRAIEARAVEEAKHAVTTASLNALEGRLAVMVADGELRAERLDTALTQVAEETADLRTQAERLEAGEIDISEVEGL